MESESNYSPIYMCRISVDRSPICNPPPTMVWYGIWYIVYTQNNIRACIQLDLLMNISISSSDLTSLHCIAYIAIYNMLRTYLSTSHRSVHLYMSAVTHKQTHKRRARCIAIASMITTPTNAILSSLSSSSPLQPN